MDNTVLLATSREENGGEVIVVVYRNATDIDMLIHPVKSKYLAVNTADNTAFGVPATEITYTDSQ